MAISLRNISVGYASRTLLQGVTTDIASASLTALIGRNGTGKSTLLRAISGLESPRTGKIELDGSDVARMTPIQRATAVSFVTTDKIRIPNLLCEDVVALGRAPYTNWIGRMHSTDREIVYEALRQVGMESFAKKSLDTMSDGECQRVMIARALAQQTSVILLDEPTAFLDLPSRYELCTLLKQLTRQSGKTILFSTHDLDIALTLCDAIALIDTPHLHHLPTAAMVASGHIERLFTADGMLFDVATQRILPKK